MTKFENKKIAVSSKTNTMKLFVLMTLHIIRLYTESGRFKWFEGIYFDKYCSSVNRAIKKLKLTYWHVRIQWFEFNLINDCEKILLDFLA